MAKSSSAFTPDSLVDAVRHLFRLNNYDVTGPFHVHGAELDLAARPRTDPFGHPLYIEVTVEYVDTEKYGKDLSKLAMLATKEPQSRRLIVSSRGFTADVRERARETNIECLTYEELFAKFEQFSSYAVHVTGTGDYASELAQLDSVYEEPSFSDSTGENLATQFVSTWLREPTPKYRWLVITGEYGTGKTALSKILLRRWMRQYLSDPSSPIPFRLELRDFTHQFDAHGLIHHFLDKNHLGHISIDFVLSLIRNGRIVLILDGYDEMAQYMHARERRACLEALATLSTDGARGILTSRPNYFSEAEELQLFDVLYRSLTTHTYASATTREATEALLTKEKELDALLEAQFVNRFERRLRDLTPEQTENLVARVLVNDASGQAAVLQILRRVFRTLDRGEAIALSGKPVIISYLLEVVESLKTSEAQPETLSEWQIYGLIVEQLMLRDYKRSPLIEPSRRIQFLEALAIALSQRDTPFIDEENFRSLVVKNFTTEIRRATGSARSEEVERYFADLRGSATLTRGGDGDQSSSWRFSHNSLREYFAARHLLSSLQRQEVPKTPVPITDAMRVFLASLDDSQLVNHQTLLAKLWNHEEGVGVGALFALLWDGIKRLHRIDADPVRSALAAIAGTDLDCSALSFGRVSFSGDNEQRAQLKGFSIRSGVLVDVDLSYTDLQGARFDDALCENVRFDYAKLANVNFRGAYLIDISLTGTDVTGADFTGVLPDNISAVVELDDGERQLLEGSKALGYLKYNGAVTSDVPILHVVCHHPNYTIVEKILRRLSEQDVRQRLGLVQRGAARQDTAFAENFVGFLERRGFVESKSRRDLVSLTEQGRDLVNRILERGEVDEEVARFLGAELSSRRLTPC